MKNVFLLAIAIFAFSACNNKYSSAKEDDMTLSANSSREDSLLNYNSFAYALVDEDVVDYDDYEDEVEYEEYEVCSVGSSNKYYYASKDGFGNVTVHDLDGNYYYVSVDEFGNVSAHDLDGNYYHSSTDDFGNTTGYDSNGNYYSAYTDDFGNTTINVY